MVAANNTHLEAMHSALKRYRHRLGERFRTAQRHRKAPTAPIEPGNITRILVCRPNHRLGNQLALTPLLAELEAEFPGAEIDVVAGSDIADELYRGYQNVAHILHLPRHALRAPFQYLSVIRAVRRTHYDLAINAIPKSSTGAALCLRADATSRIIDFPQPDECGGEVTHFAKVSVYLLREYLPASPSKSTAIPNLDIRLSPDERRAGRMRLEQIRDNTSTTARAKTVALYTHATGSKCYGKRYWGEIHRVIRRELPDYFAIEFLPAHGHSMFEHTIPTLFSSNVRKLAAALSAADVVVSADGGVMHLASAAQTPTIGLFSVNNPLAFSPYGNKSCAIETTGHSPETIAKMVVSKIEEITAPMVPLTRGARRHTISQT